ncbi:MAG: hypothetical protein HYV09_10205 [Deltaproteobacteria bacterium]|nr:hypothetical protein [Deltaproteobacteria bacterium]
MVAAIGAMGAHPDFIECVVTKTPPGEGARAADVRYRAYDDHIEVRLRVTDGSSMPRELTVASTAPGEPIPYVSNWFPVSSVKFTRGGVALVDGKRQVLREVPLDR